MNDEATAPHHCTAILVAAGSGSRMGFDKLLAPLLGTSVLQRSLDRLLQCDSIHSIVLVCPQDRWDSLAVPTSQKSVSRTDGGTLRQHSVARGIAYAPPHTTHLAIHDAARPLVSVEDLNRVIRAAQVSGAASLAHRVVDTLKRTDDHLQIRDSVSRDDLWAMETPQVFARTLLEQSLSVADNRDLLFTDEVSLLQAAGHPIHLIESLHPNPKITTPADLALAQAILTLSKNG